MSAVDVLCDMCGDIAIAYVPIKVRFFNGSRLTINLCLDCWKEFKSKSRKYLVAKMLKVFLEE